jgi:hypothetical protein
LLSWGTAIYLSAAGGETPAESPAPQALVLRDEHAAFDAAAVATLFTGQPVPGGIDDFLTSVGGYRHDADNALSLDPDRDMDFFVPVADVEAKSNEATRGYCSRSRTSADTRRSSRCLQRSPASSPMSSNDMPARGGDAGGATAHSDSKESDALWVLEVRPSGAVFAGRRV